MPPSSSTEPPRHANSPPALPPPLPARPPPPPGCPPPAPLRPPPAPLKPPPTPLVPPPFAAPPPAPLTPPARDDPPSPGRAPPSVVETGSGPQERDHAEKARRRGESALFMPTQTRCSKPSCGARASFHTFATTGREASVFSKRLPESVEVLVALNRVVSEDVDAVAIPGGTTWREQATQILLANAHRTQIFQQKRERIAWLA
jgi:hypothetical protein